MARCERNEAENEFDIGRGLVNGLLISIPLWIILGIALALVFQRGPMDESIRTALMIAAVSEAILVFPYLRTLFAGIRRRADFHHANSRRDTVVREARPAPHARGNRDRPQRDLERIAGRSLNSIEELLRYVEPKSVPSHKARRVAAPNGLFRRTLALSALVGAYLQYYFLDVNLQIASLHPLTLGLPVASMT
jgi:hypothetical protein